jgi:homocitrate synthase
VDDVDTLLRVYHQAITNGEIEIGQRSKIDALLEKHKGGKRSNGDSAESQSPVSVKKAKAATNGHA